MMSFWISLSAQAATPIAINKNESAPFDGFLVDRDTVLNLRKIDLENTELHLINDSLNKSVKLYKDNEDLFKQKESTLLEQNDKLAISLSEARSTTNWERAAWFVGGVLISGLAFYGATKLYSK